MTTIIPASFNSAGVGYTIDATNAAGGDFVLPTLASVEGLTGIAITAGATLTNFGLIEGLLGFAGPTAISTPAISVTSADPVAIVNKGNIVGPAIFSNVTSGIVTTGPTTVTNYGFIVGIDASGASAAETISNYGNIFAFNNNIAITTGSGNDVITLHTGSTAAVIDGGGGSDVLNLLLDDRTGTSAVAGANSNSTTGTVGGIAAIETINLGAGIWSLGGNFAFGSAADTLRVTIAGAGAAQRGELHVSGTVDLSGSHLAIALGSGFDPAGQTFTLLTSAGITGRFAEGSRIAVGGYIGTLDYAGGTSGHDLTISFTVATVAPTGKGIIFEEATAATAENFASGDILLFKAATATGLGFAFTPAAGLRTDIVTLTAGGHSLSFGAVALHDSAAAGQLTFFDGSSLYVAAAAGNSYSLASAKAGAVYGLGGNDAFTVGGDGAHVVDAGAGNDAITATGAGAMTLSGGAGADTIDAGSTTGNLHIYGNSQASMRGDADGNDLILVGTGSNYVNGNAGDDTITATLGGSGVDRLWGGAGNDVINGGSGVDSINGNAGNDVIVGHGVSDYLRGGQGDDSIVAGAGATQLFGDLGNDTLVAGSGIAVMTGGAGNDLFVFATGTAALPQAGGALAGYVDEIADFTIGQDHIHLAGIGGATPAHLIFQDPGIGLLTESAARTYAQALLSGSTTAGAHDVVALQVGNDTFVYSQSGGAGTAVDMVVKLDGVSAGSLTAASFV